MRYRLTLAAALVCAAPAALADGTSKNAFELFTQCTSEHSPFNQGICLGYLAGVVDHASGAAASGHSTPRFCVPEDFRLADGVSVYVTYMDGNRAARSALATTAVLTAFERAYPCP